MVLTLCAVVQAAPIEVVVGARDGSATAGRVDGPRVGARWILDATALELNLGANAAPGRVGLDDALLVELGHERGLQVPVFTELCAAQILVDHGFEAPAGDRWETGAHLYGGVDVAVGRRDTVVWREPQAGLDPGRSSLAAGPVLGAGADVWFGSRVGVRVMWLGRLRVERKPTYGADVPASEWALRPDSMRSVDVLVRF